MNNDEISKKKNTQKPTGNEPENELQNPPINPLESNGHPIAAREAAPPEEDAATTSGETSDLQDKINRSAFKFKPNRKFTTFFDRIGKNVGPSGLFANCVPTPEQIAAQNTDLQALMQRSIDTRSDVNTTLFGMAVEEAKKTALKIASFVEINYPGNTNVAKLLGMEFKKKSPRISPAPKQVENVQVTPYVGYCILQWDSIKGFPATGIYEVYISTDGGKTFPISKGCRREKDGLRIETTKLTEYVFYVVAKTTGGRGPASEKVYCVGQ